MTAQLQIHYLKLMIILQLWAEDIGFDLIWILHLGLQICFEGFPFHVIPKCLFVHLIEIALLAFDDFSDLAELRGWGL